MPQTKSQPKNWRYINFNKTSFDIADLFQIALGRTLERDGDILERGRSERLFVNRLACNLQLSLDGLLGEENILRVDSPYNKHFNGTKKIGGQEIEIDLALHQRGTDQYNFFVAEIETNNTPARDDIWKIEEMTRQNGEYKYKAGLYLALGVKNKAGKVISEEWYIDGAKVN